MFTYKQKNNFDHLEIIQNIKMLLNLNSIHYFSFLLFVVSHENNKTATHNIFEITIRNIDALKKFDQPKTSKRCLKLFHFLWLILMLCKKGNGLYFIIGVPMTNLKVILFQEL